MNNGIIYFLSLIFIVVISGCTSNFDATEFVKTNQAIKTLLTDYPNAKIVATYVTNASISEECINPQLEAKDYWKVSILDESTNLTVNAWLDVDTRNVVCIIKTGGKELTNASQNQSHAIQNQTQNQTQIINATQKQPHILQCPDIYNCSDDDYCSDGVCKVLNCEEGYHAENHTCKLTVYIPRLNCRELGGHLCSDITISIGPLTSSTSPRCALSWLNSTDSYCCPIECGSCPTDCNDGNPCTSDSCNIGNNTFQCSHTQIKPCINNGICEPEELGCINTSPIKCENTCG